MVMIPNTVSLANLSALDVGIGPLTQQSNIVHSVRGLSFKMPKWMQLRQTRQRRRKRERWLKSGRAIILAWAYLTGDKQPLRIML